MFTLRTTPKPKHKRNVPKRIDRGKFSKETIQAINERDNFMCIKCGSPYIEPIPHHIVLKSAMGLGTVDNGATVCSECHRLAHSSREGREWFEQYRIKHLI